MTADKIDIESLTGGQVLNLAGHERGQAAREKFHLDDIDSNEAVVEVHFPERFRGMSSSFFQGMFAESVQKRGSVEEFFEHFRFAAPAHVMAQIFDYAEQALSRRDH